MNASAYISLLVERLLQIQPEKIILFGSHAYGEPTDDSDLDILVVTSDNQIPSNFTEKSEIYLRVSKTISDIKKDFPVDLIVHTKAMHDLFNKTDSMFAKEVRKMGKVLYEKNH
jgi:uncharacterized protein